MASRRADACKETEEHLRGLGGEAIGVPTHLAELDDLAELVRRTVDEFGGVDVVVNNAATALAQPIGQYTPEAWQKSPDVNLRGPVFLVQEALPHLERSQHAAVLNRAGAAGRRRDGAALMAGPNGGLVLVDRPRPEVAVVTLQARPRRLRHRHQLHAAPADRRGAGLRAAADRPPGGRRRGRPHRPGRGCDPLDRYPTLTVTLQDEGGGQESSGRVVLSGEVGG